MSSLIKFDFKELRHLANDKQSCVIEKTITQNLALEPWSLGNIKESIKNVLDFKIGKFIKELNGILISYKNLRILKSVGAIRNDNSDVNFQIQADYYIFQPYVGAILKGIVIKKHLTHLVVLLYRVFNVVIPRPTEEHGNVWPGLSVQENQEVAFKIVVLDLYGALPYIRGELDERLSGSGNGAVDGAGERDHAKIMKVDYQQQIDDKLIPSAKNYNGTNVTAKKYVPSDTSSIDQRRTGDVIEVNLHNIKSKNKRHKDYAHKHYDSDIKQIQPKSKHVNNSTKI